MHSDLVDEDREIGRHRTARLMRENRLIARQKRRFKRLQTLVMNEEPAGGRSVPIVFSITQRRSAPRPFLY